MRPIDVTRLWNSSRKSSNGTIIPLALLTCTRLHTRNQYSGAPERASCLLLIDTQTTHPEKCALSAAARSATELLQCVCYVSCCISPAVGEHHRSQSSLPVGHAIYVSSTEFAIAWALNILAFAANHLRLHFMHVRIAREPVSHNLEQEDTEHKCSAHSAEEVSWVIRAGRLDFGTRTLCAKIFCWCASRAKIFC